MATNEASVLLLVVLARRTRRGREPTDRVAGRQGPSIMTRLEGYLTWTIWACPECGRDRGPVAQYIYRRCQCGSHCPQREVEVVPADDLRGAVDLLRDAREWIGADTEGDLLSELDLLRRIDAHLNALGGR